MAPPNPPPPPSDTPYLRSDDENLDRFCYRVDADAQRIFRPAVPRPALLFFEFSGALISRDGLLRPAVRGKTSAAPSGPVWRELSGIFQGAVWFEREISVGEDVFLLRIATEPADDVENSGSDTLRVLYLAAVTASEESLPAGVPDKVFTAARKEILRAVAVPAPAARDRMPFRITDERERKAPCLEELLKNALALGRRGLFPKAMASLAPFLALVAEGRTDEFVLLQLYYAASVPALAALALLVPDISDATLRRLAGAYLLHAIPHVLPDIQDSRVWNALAEAARAVGAPAEQVLFAEAAIHSGNPVPNAMERFLEAIGVFARAHMKAPFADDGIHWVARAVDAFSDEEWADHPELPCFMALLTRISSHELDRHAIADARFYLQESMSRQAERPTRIPEFIAAFEDEKKRLSGHPGRKPPKNAEKLEPPPLYLPIESPLLFQCWQMHMDFDLCKKQFARFPTPLAETGLLEGVLSTTTRLPPPLPDFWHPFSEDSGSFFESLLVDRFEKEHDGLVPLCEPRDINPLFDSDGEYKFLAFLSEAFPHGPDFPDPANPPPDVIQARSMSADVMGRSLKTERRCISAVPFPTAALRGTNAVVRPYALAADPSQDCAEVELLTSTLRYLAAACPTFAEDRRRLLPDTTLPAYLFVCADELHLATAAVIDCPGPGIFPVAHHGHLSYHDFYGYVVQIERGIPVQFGGTTDRYTLDFSESFGFRLPVYVHPSRVKSDIAPGDAVYCFGLLAAVFPDAGLPAAPDAPAFPEPAATETGLNPEFLAARTQATTSPAASFTDTSKKDTFYSDRGLEEPSEEVLENPCALKDFDAVAAAIRRLREHPDYRLARIHALPPNPKGADLAVLAAGGKGTPAHGPAAPSFFSVQKLVGEHDEALPSAWPSLIVRLLPTRSRLVHIRYENFPE